MRQCPLGLIPHFYRSDCALPEQLGLYVSMPSRAYTSFLLGIGLFWSMYDVRCVNALSGLYLISTNTQGIAIEHAYDVSMPSRAYTSFLRYSFKNLGFMRFPEPVFAGIYQNILTTAVFHAC